MAKPAPRSAALWVLRRLRDAGHQALFAGGCVRDMLLGIPCSDYDVATDATPQQVKRLFGHVLLIGAKFGVAMVIHKGKKIEVTTFRSDVSYSDGRRPDEVRFSTPREDALRRDFTINGMFYDPTAREVIDYVGGRDDLQRKVVRTIGQPQRRFAEDFLRMIRAVRFTVRLDFSIHPGTAAAIRRHAGRITSISGERIFDEMDKMLSRDSAGRALRLMHELNLAEAILPELFADSLWADAISRVEAVAGRKDSVAALGALLAELPQKTIVRIVRRWGASNDLRDGVCWMARHVGDWRVADEMPLAQFKRLVANQNFDRLRLLWRTEERSETRRDVRCRRISRRIAAIDPAEIAPPPLIRGCDVKAMGLTEGPKVGRVLRAVYDAQLNEQITTRAAAMKAAREMIQRGR